jgi:wyosine [tRNA(Phe)-imidazoG37] synthetase (radical SAM superfamily)
MNSETKAEANGAASPAPPCGTAFGCPRDFLENRFIYAVISPRARGLSVGVNMNPDKLCNFNCVYCEVDRREPSGETRLDVEVMISELERTLEEARDGRIRERLHYQTLPEELLQLRHVALSGDGEPTRCPNFAEAVEAIMHLRALGRFPFFKLVLITNASGLDSPEVSESLQLFTPRDEIWAKLEAGTEEYFKLVDRTPIPFRQILDNITAAAQERPIVIQALFMRIHGEPPTRAEQEAFCDRLSEITAAGGRIKLVQIYTVARRPAESFVAPLTDAEVDALTELVQQRTGLEAAAFYGAAGTG